MIRQPLPLVVAGALLGAALPAAAQPGGIAVRDSFRVGSDGVLCTAQNRPTEAALKGMFDRGYAIVCRDAAAPVGRLFALRSAVGDDALTAIMTARPGGLQCQPAADAAPDAGGVQAIDCQSEAQVRYRGYAQRRGGTLFLAEGLAGYDPALKLGLRTIVEDRPVEGVVEVATTAAGDPAAFARVQAGTLDADSALAEAYQRNNSGSFAEAAEFFETLVARETPGGGAARSAEYLANQGLQQSNLGSFAAAESLFAQAEARGAAGDPVASRLLRNARAMHLLNQRQADAALAALDRPVAGIAGLGGDEAIGRGEISPTLADQINRENAGLQRLGGVDGRLQPVERAAILDAQALQLRGIAERMQNRLPEAARSLGQASARLAAVRNGRITSTAFMRSATEAELALIAEARGDAADAERHFAESQRMLDVDYPGSAGALAARARLAAFLARSGDSARALPLYAEVVAASQKLPGSATTMRALLAPYFALLASRVETDPAAAEAMFAASQIMVRPGVAQTQAVFARELSGGDDAAAALFRQSVTLSREVTRTGGEVARAAALAPAAGTPQAAELAAARARLTALEAEQTALQSKLADFPRYRVLAPPALTLAELRGALREGEAYYQLRIVGPDVYGMLVTPAGARALKVASTAAALEADVAKLRDSIVTIENGQPSTYPFDLALSRRLYLALFGALGEPLAGVTNLIFEPDGPLLQLPVNLLATGQAGVDAYAERQKRPGADEFDFRGVAWLGRDRNVTTAVSPRSFVDVRAIAPAKGRYAYLGLGHNAVPQTQPVFLRTAAPTPAADCSWPIEVWRNPISPAELQLASRIVGAERSAVITDQPFNDTALKARTDLDAYRVLHFATHGLVTAPRPQCPARPALVTSFGDDGSDGLLSFREIYDLKLDADVVVLSACDTAGMATIEATRDAGIATGGNFALDGLVRAFVGAGARSVIASHWPIPDDYDATKRLMQALFSAPPGTAMATALRTGQRALMDEAATSHPYYWSAFAVVGDGEQPLLRK